MKITGETFEIDYEPTESLLILRGILRPYGAAGYFSIDDFTQSREGSVSQNDDGQFVSLMELFEDLLTKNPKAITIDLQALELLNSSGINTLSKFVIKARNEKNGEILIKGTERYFWQGKILSNLKKLMPELLIELA
jgi:hypothetical protein